MITLEDINSGTLGKVDSDCIIVTEDLIPMYYNEELQCYSELPLTLMINGNLATLKLVKYDIGEQNNGEEDI